jgi:hypothetical protein
MFIPGMPPMDGDGEAIVMPLIPPMPVMEGDGDAMFVPGISLIDGEGDADGMFMPVMPWRRAVRTWSGV